MRPLRPAFVVLHRWVGLATAAFLFVAGLTGAVIAFNHELDAWLNPELFRAPAPEAAPLPPLALVERFEASHPRARVTYAPLALQPGQSLLLGVAGQVDPLTQAPHDLEYSEVFLDPASGTVLGSRDWGACCLSRKQAIPFLYVLHYSLHAPGRWGVWLMGGVAVLWVVDCFVGFYLTLPVGTRRFWRSWKPAWQIARVRNIYRINFDLHRAAGLWFWAVLLVLAVSAVALNLRTEIVNPVLSLVTTVTPTPFDEPAPAVLPDEAHSLSLAAVADIARREAAQRGWPAPSTVFHSPEIGVYTVGFGDPHAPGLGARYLYFDAASGRLRGGWIPGTGTAGDLMLQSMFPLHSGQILGLPGRIFVAITGLAVSALSATGVVIWARKRRGRRALARRVAGIAAAGVFEPRRAALARESHAAPHLHSRPGQRRAV
jgi:uncharacterized iron-regulated membrane protein